MIVADFNWILTGLNMHRTELHCRSGWRSVYVNVNTPLSDYTVLEARAMIRLSGAEGVNPADIHRKIVAAYGGVNCVSQRKNPEEQVRPTKLDRGARQRRALKTTSSMLMLSSEKTVG